MGTNDCTVFVSSLESKVTEEILWELFLQAGPLRNVKIPVDKSSGKNRTFAFVTFRDECSVPYACELLNGIRLFQKPILCKPQRDSKHDTTPTKPSMLQTPNWHSSSNDSQDSFGTPSPFPFQPRSQREFFDSRGYVVGSNDSRGGDLRHVIEGRHSTPAWGDRQDHNRRHDDRGMHERRHSSSSPRHDHYGHYSPGSSPRHPGSPAYAPSSPTSQRNQGHGGLQRSYSDDRYSRRDRSFFGPVKSDSSQRHRDMRRHHSKPY